MARVRHGLVSLGQAQEAAPRGGGNEFIKHVILGNDGDTARFRCVTEWSEEMAKERGIPHVLVNGEFHRIQKTSSKGKLFWADVLCDTEFDPNTEQWAGTCARCDDSINRTTKFVTWVYLYCYYHTYQNPDVQSPWQLVNLGTRQVYKEPVEKFVVWNDGFYMSQKLRGKVDFNGCMSDRDFMVVRFGVKNGGKVTRDLEAYDPTPIPEEMLKEAADLPSLEDVVTGAVETLGSGANEGGVDPVPVVDIPQEFGPGSGAGAAAEVEMPGAATPVISLTEDPPTEEGEQGESTGVVDDLPW